MTTSIASSNASTGERHRRLPKSTEYETENRLEVVSNVKKNEEQIGPVGEWLLQSSGGQMGVSHHSDY